MKKILVIRLSALGDVIHAMPALSDIHRYWPDALIDMATDERFVEIPALHKYINRVINIPLKRLKKNLLCQANFRELWLAIQQLRVEKYDLVIDLHGLWKSALVTCLTRAQEKVGFHRRYCAESGAAWFYQRHFLPTQASSRVQVLRDLTAFALGTHNLASLDYGFRCSSAPALVRGRIVFFHSASRDDRCWPEEKWISLGCGLIADGYEIELPWGTSHERKRSEYLQEKMGYTGCVIPPLLTISQWAERLSSISLVVGVDSGLTHLAAALDVPCVSIFTASCPDLLVPQKTDRAVALGREGAILEWPVVLQACRQMLLLTARAD